MPVPVPLVPKRDEPQQQQQRGQQQPAIEIPGPQPDRVPIYNPAPARRVMGEPAVMFAPYRNGHNPRPARGREEPPLFIVPDEQQNGENPVHPVLARSRYNLR